MCLLCHHLFTVKTLCCFYNDDCKEDKLARFCGLTVCLWCLSVRFKLPKLSQLDCLILRACTKDLQRQRERVAFTAFNMLKQIQFFYKSIVSFHIKTQQHSSKNLLLQHRRINKSAQ